MRNWTARIGRGLTMALAGLALATGGVTGTAPLWAQVRTVDPDKAIDGDLVPLPQQAAPGAATAAPSIGAAPVAQGSSPVEPTFGQVAAQAQAQAQAQGGPTAASAEKAAAAAAANPVQARQQGGTYKQDDLIGAAEGVFGKGAQGLADLIKDLLAKQGEPNGYIVGREGGGAIVVGLRYGSGTLYHKVEGQKPVYWTGPSIGIDAGASAGNTFVLVYNLFNTDDLYHRFGAGEGQAYLLGGFHVSYLRRGDVVLIPVRMGVGLRLGVNAGYMKISRKARWFPF
ncbi:DUF1134 domain-containing protein [Novosphingobium flavum]|uniref:DUF1134 domain-containing protein n=1 Tax=Novosphingobium aerophilum TaxID=2839843 RepID=A0A7X1FAD5_9SPHN|nr:DUF1134 domain-containing protein [Novosphingobium aerophilum]MBC2663605.1 DUF1134 domain-containing protein [Novosphingobium aerophilum]